MATASDSPSGGAASPARRARRRRLRSACSGPPRSGPALVGDLTPAGMQEAIDAGTASITQDDFAEEWQLRLPGGEEVAVSTPFSRLALAARQAAMKGESLTDKQRQEQIDRGKGRIQLLVTMYGRDSGLRPLVSAGPRWWAAARSRRPSSRTSGRRCVCRTAATRPRNVYVFPLEELPTKGAVTLVVRAAPPDHKEVLRAPLDLGKFR